MSHGRKEALYASAAASAHARCLRLVICSQIEYAPPMTAALTRGVDGA